MLATVLNSETAVQANIPIMRPFIRHRRMLGSYADLVRKLGFLEKKYNHQFRIAFDAIRELMVSPAKPQRRICFEGKDAADDKKWRSVDLI